ncbi:MFS general substrate transporter [Pleurotus eryngii]|uniref:MFS general substrate transporter n=1 Tax=Pleurotus eryngii TaxID=5323 RepID=A0A9P6DBT9_PLEER|nr:MFS general substrate transporter [Pleurotus eryngii]
MMNPNSPRAQLSPMSSDSPTPTLLDTQKLEQGPQSLEPIIEFEAGDTRNPVNWSRGRKWFMTIVACIFTVTTAAAAGAYNLGFTSMTRDLNCTNFQATIGLSVYPLGYGVISMLTVSFSEEFGRHIIYLFSSLGFTAMFTLIALGPNIQIVILARFLQAAFAATGATMVGGTIADMWESHERGIPMATFSYAAFAGIALGPIVGGWIEMNPRLQWRWIQWVQLIINAAYIILYSVTMRETRSSIILLRIARNLRNKTGDARYIAPVEIHGRKIWNLVYTACTRPLYLLLTEPIVTSFSVWVGFAWGVTYGVLESIPEGFRTFHHFNDGEIGTVFVSMLVGSTLGFLSNLYQDKVYVKYVAFRGPEARLYSACVAAIILPVGMLIYAWTSFPFVHWIAPCIGFGIFMGATFIIFLVVCNYLADCYGPYASSALAGSSLLRNGFATVFPLFMPQMFEHLSYKWAGTLIAGVAALLIPIPFVLFFFGPQIRSRSKFSISVT